MKPEDKARVTIDKKLIESGWTIQDVKSLNLSASLGIAVREFPTPSTVNTVFDLCLIRSSEDGYFFVNFLNHLELCRLSQNEYIGKSNMQSIQNAIINGLKHSNDRVKQKYVWLCKFFNEQIDRSCLLNIEKYIITEDESVLFK